MLQLNPQIPVNTPKGPGQALFIIDYSEEHDLKWVVCLDLGGEMWCFPNKDIRGIPNYTMGRRPPPAPAPVHTGPILVK